MIAQLFAILPFQEGLCQDGAKAAKGNEKTGQELVPGTPSFLAALLRCRLRGQSMIDKLMSMFEDDVWVEGGRDKDCRGKVVK